MKILRCHPPPGRLLAIACLCAALLLGGTNFAQASVLLPGQFVSPVSQDGTLGLTLVASVAPMPFSFTTSSGTISGTYQEFVAVGRTGNPFGGLSFEYQFTVDKASTRDVSSFSVGGYGGWDTNVTFAPGGTEKPMAAVRSATGDGIEYLMDVQPGLTSMWLIVDTNAPSFQPSTISLQGDGGSSGAKAALGPAVPEPATITLLGIGLAGMAGYGWRKRRRS
jgi:hypothetical protein